MPEQIAEAVQQLEVGVGQRVGLHWLKLHEQVNVALTGTVVVAKGGAEDVEAGKLKRARASGNRLLIVPRSTSTMKNTSTNMLPGGEPETTATIAGRSASVERWRAARLATATSQEWLSSNHRLGIRPARSAVCLANYSASKSSRNSRRSGLCGQEWAGEGRGMSELRPGIGRWAPAAEEAFDDTVEESIRAGGAW